MKKPGGLPSGYLGAKLWKATRSFGNFIIYHRNFYYQLRKNLCPLSHRPTMSSPLDRWGGKESLAKPESWVGVPDAYLPLYAKLQPYALTTSEAMFVLELMTYKWSGESPFLSYKSLAGRMGVTDKMVRRYAANLEVKGYLKREARIGSTNTLNLNGLFVALAARLKAERSLPKAA